MSNVPQGPGWWFAADGRWYPPGLQPGYGPPTPGSWPEPGPSGTAGRRRRLVAWLAGALGLVVLATLVAVYAASSGQQAASPTTTVSPGPITTSVSSPGKRLLLGPVSASTQLTADRGTVVFSDDFTDPESGWQSAPLPSGTTFGYGPGGYVVVARGHLHHFAYSPYIQPVQQLNTSLTALESAGAPSGAGFGVVCRRGQGQAEVQYEFLVLGASWVVERRDGATGSTPPTILQQGTTAVHPGPVPVTVVAMCATETDGRTTRLALFLNGSKVADLANRAATFQDTGWRGGIDVASVVSSTVTANRFEERDMAL
jgi:hypothetical protein